MGAAQLQHDPFNLIITGVGGQGNVLASKVVGRMLVSRGLSVTIGETFGASQRGGSVMSHLRVSAGSAWSPLIPSGRAHMIISLEPIEALRVMAAFGNPEVAVICNNRPVNPIGVICGDYDYPELEQVDRWLGQYSSRHWLLPAHRRGGPAGQPPS